MERSDGGSLLVRLLNATARKRSSARFATHQDDSHAAALYSSSHLEMKEIE